MRLRRGLLVVAVAGCGISDCLDPTEVEVVLSTDVPCASLQNAAIAIGRPGDDDSGVVAVSTMCSDDGGLGTLVVVPSGDGDEVGIRATLGVSVSADSCVAPDFAGCVVARRSLAYIPHRPLILPIDLQSSCLGNPCDPNTTCVNGACVDAGISDCPNDTCNVADAGVPIQTDGGACDVGPTVVTTVPVAPVQPHLVLTSAGFAIGYETAAKSSSREYYAVAVDANGNPGATKKLGAPTPNLPAAALGSDGTHYATAMMGDPASVFGVELPIGPGNVITSAAGPAVDISGFGMIWDAATTSYWFLASGTTNSVELVGFSPSNAGVTTRPLDSSPDSTALAFSASGGKYFATYLNSNGNCQLQTCTALNPPSCTAASPLNGCTTMRAATVGGATLVATRDGSGQGAAFLESAPNTRKSFGPLDAQGLVVLATSGAFEIVWGASGSILSAPVSTALDVTGTSTLVTAGSAPLLFDAVADPVPSSGYAVAYYSATPAPGIYYLHRCQ